MTDKDTQIAMYRADVERIWALMPDLRNTDAHYEIFEAVHEALARKDAMICTQAEKLAKLEMENHTLTHAIEFANDVIATLEAEQGKESGE